MKPLALRLLCREPVEGETEKDDDDLARPRTTLQTQVPQQRTGELISDAKRKERMSVVTGVVSFAKNTQKTKALGYKRVDVGYYQFRPTGTIKHKTALRMIAVDGVECPYCHGSLTRLDPRDGRMTGRVIGILSEAAERQDLLLDPVPDDRWIVKCGAGCAGAVFSVFKEQRKRTQHSAATD